MVVGLGYGAYKAAPYVSAIAKQKWMQYRGIRLNAPQEEQKGDSSSLLTTKIEEVKDNEKLKEFIEVYMTEEEKKNSASSIIEKLKEVAENDKEIKAIDCNDQKFKVAVLNNDLADEMLTSLNFEKEGTMYIYKGTDTARLKAAIKYFERFT